MSNGAATFLGGALGGALAFAGASLSDHENSGMSTDASAFMQDYVAAETFQNSEQNDLYSAQAVPPASVGCATAPASGLGLVPTLLAMALASRPERSGSSTTTSPTSSGRAPALAGPGGNPGIKRPECTLIKKLGEGGFGEVWLASVESGGITRKFAVKFVKNVPGTDPQILEECNRRERDAAKMLAEVNDSRVLAPQAIGTIAAKDGNRLTVIITEYVEGISLGGNNRSLADPHAVLEIISDVAAVLHKLYHAETPAGPLNIVHRDIKPANIMIDVAGRIKLIDFGTARAALSDREAHTTDRVALTQEYAAPEFFVDQQRGHSADIYALGITMYELVTGSRFKSLLAHNNKQWLPVKEKEQTEWLDFLFGEMERYLRTHFADEISDAWLARFRELFFGMMAFDHTERWDGEKIAAFIAERYDGKKTLLSEAPGDDLRSLGRGKVAVLANRGDAGDSGETHSLGVPRTFTLNSDFGVGAGDLTGTTQLAPVILELDPDPEIPSDNGINLGNYFLAGGLLVVGIPLISAAILGGIFLANGLTPEVTDAPELAPVIVTEVPSSDPMEVLTNEPVMASVSAPIPAPVATDNPQKTKPAPVAKPAKPIVAEQAQPKAAELVAAKAEEPVPPPRSTYTITFTGSGGVKEFKIISGAKKVGGSTQSPKLDITGDAVVVEVEYGDGEKRKFRIPKESFSASGLRIGKDDARFK